MGYARVQYKVSKKTVGNKTGDAYCLTVPSKVMESFSTETRFSLAVIDYEGKKGIFYASGPDLSQLKKEAQSVDFNQIR